MTKRADMNDVINDVNITPSGHKKIPQNVLVLNNIYIEINCYYTLVL